MRRNPRRTRLWSSTRNTEIVFSDMNAFCHRHSHAHQRAPGFNRFDFNIALHHPGPLTHRDKTQALPASLPDPHAFILHFESNGVGPKRQPHGRILRSGMARHIVQRLLRNAVEMSRYLAVEFSNAAGLFKGDLDTCLPLESRQIRIERALQPDLIERYRVKSMRERPDLFERRLNNLAHLLQSLGGGLAISIPARRSLQSNSDCRQYLAE